MPAHDDPICHYQYCGTWLSPHYDYACPRFGHEACDNDNQACQAEGCDDITCIRRVSIHQEAFHLVGPRLM